MATYFYVQQIAEFWRDDFKTNLQVDLGLVTCMAGDIEAFPNAANLDASVPGVFVIPASVDVEPSETGGLWYWETYHYEIIHVDRIPEGSPPLANRARISRFADRILKNYLMAGLPAIVLAPLGQPIRAIPTRMDLNPPENVFVKAVNAQLTATKLYLDVKLEVNVP